MSRIVWSAIFQAKSDLVGTSSALRKLVGSSVSAAVPSALVASSTSEQEVHSRYMITAYQQIQLPLTAIHLR